MSAQRRVLVKVDRNGKTKWLIGTVIGKKSFVKNDRSPFDFITRDVKHNPVKEWNEDKLLIRIARGNEVEAWDHETYEVV